MSGTGMSGTG
jgi:hypothetical protein